jgi:hypothetical protein
MKKASVMGYPQRGQGATGSLLRCEGEDEAKHFSYLNKWICQWLATFNNGRIYSWQLMAEVARVVVTKEEVTVLTNMGSNTNW